MDSGRIKAGVIVALLLTALAVFDSYGSYSHNVLTGAAVAGAEALPTDQEGECPGSVLISSDKQTEYGRDETVRFTIWVLNVGGFPIKRGANLVIKSDAGAVKSDRTVPAGTDSGIITVDVPASQFEGGAYTAEASSGSSSCAPMSNKQPFTVTAAAKAKEETPLTPPQTMPPVPTMPGLPPPPSMMEVSIAPGWNLVSINTLKNAFSKTCAKGQVDSAYAYFIKADDEDSTAEEVWTWGRYKLSDDLTKLEPKDPTSANLIINYPETVSEARAVWVRNTGEACKIVTGLMPQAGGTTLAKGWNMVAVPANIKDMKLYNFLGDCKFNRGFFFSPEDQSFEQMQLRLESYSSDSSFAQLNAGQVFEEFIGRGFWVSVKAKCKFGVAPSSAPPPTSPDLKPTVRIQDLPLASPTPGSTVVVTVSGSDDNGVSVLLLYDENSNPLDAYPCPSGRKTCSYGFTATLPSTFGTPYTFKAKSADSANQLSDFATWTVTTTAAAQSDSYVYQPDEGRLEETQTQPKQTVSCPATLSLDFLDPGGNTYVQDEDKTATITATIRDKNGAVIKRGASIEVTSFSYDTLVSKGDSTATDSGIITFGVPLNAENYLPGGYIVKATSASGQDACSPVSGRTSFTVTKKAEESNPADLAPISLGYDKTTIKAGDIVNFKAAITNKGGTGTDSFKVSWYVDTTGVKTSDHPAMATGETDTNHPSVNYKWTTTEGTHKIWVYVDIDNAIPESKEDNNWYLTEVTVENAQTAPAQAQPDLKVNTPYHSPSTIKVGDTVKFSASIENIGSYSPFFQVNWYVGSRLVKEDKQQNLPAGGSYPATLDWVATEGEYSVRVYADINNEVKESDEGNNWASTTVTVEAAEPDLKVDAVQYPIIFSSNYRADEAVKFSARIWNIGGTSTQSFNLVWKIDDKEIVKGTLKIPEAGGYEVEGIAWKATAGKHKVELFADSDYAVKESDEGNNKGSTTITVTAR